MNKIKELIIGTNNTGKYREICDLLPKKVKKYSPREFDILSPRETGKSFKKNSLIKASYFSKKTNLICLSDDSGLEIDILKGAPGIFSSRWGGKKKNFDLAIKKVFLEMSKIKKNWQYDNSAKFVCCLTLFWPNNKSFTSKGIINGSISTLKKGNKGFGYDPIFIPNNYSKTFAEMKPKLKMSIDHRYKAYTQISKFF
jgi:XTP/dITP diphosphohydrolase